MLLDLSSATVSLYHRHTACFCRSWQSCVVFHGQHNSSKVRRLLHTYKAKLRKPFLVYVQRRLILCSSTPCCPSLCNVCLLWQALSFLGAAVNVARLPERLFVVPLGHSSKKGDGPRHEPHTPATRRVPGAFDYWLNSHQIVRPQALSTCT